MASLTVGFSSTQSASLDVSYGARSGDFTGYCILENSVDSSACSWVSSNTLPGSFKIKPTYGNKVLSLWLRNSAGAVSTRVDSNPLKYHYLPKVSAGHFHSCAVASNGGLSCWGYNLTGQLGDGSTDDSNSPVPVSGLSNATSVSAGLYHSCATISDGGVKCWGFNSDSQIGNNSVTHYSHVPVSVDGVGNALAIGSGSKHSCALISGGGVMCWGRGVEGQLGNGQSLNSLAAGLVLGIDNAVAVGSGGENTCAVLVSGEVKCWGRGADGQLGNGSSSNSNIPAPVSGINNAVAISVGERHSCAVLSTGQVKCWGYNEYGQLGDGLMFNANTPVTVSGVSDAVGVGVGLWHTCAVLYSGEVKCWGGNQIGQLGTQLNRGTAAPVVSPSLVAGVSNAVGIASGRFHSCAKQSAGGVMCWGYNENGQLGNGSNTSSVTPVQVPGIP